MLLPSLAEKVTLFFSLIQDIHLHTRVRMPWILQHVLRAPSSGWVGPGNAFSYLQNVTVLDVDVPLPWEHAV